MTAIPQRPERYAHAFAGVAGALVYILVAQAGGTPVAWSSLVYFWLGWPLMCSAVFLIARRYPQRSWRWPLSMMLGQIFASILYGNGAMIPIAVIYVTVLSLPQFLVADRTSKAVLRHLPSEQVPPEQESPSP